MRCKHCRVEIEHVGFIGRLDFEPIYVQIGGPPDSPAQWCHLGVVQRHELDVPDDLDVETVKRWLDS